jgi:mRNA interferase MazF
MTPGDIVLIELPQVAGGPPKLRPALVLSLLPGPYQNVLICGVSTQMHPVADWDETLSTTDADFRTFGLHRESSIRLSYLYAADQVEIRGVIGRIDSSRLSRLLHRLAEHLVA